MARGSIEKLKTGFRARVYAGIDPITKKQTYLRGETRKFERDAQRDIERLLAQADADQVPDQSATLSVLLDRWLEVVAHELSTREATDGYIRRTLKPALGDMPLRKLQHRVDIIDRLYTHLRRCSILCDGRPFIEHKTDGPHDCAKAKCGPHACKPMAPSTVRRIHGILSPALNYAVAWGWIERNPAEYAHPPKVGRSKARPPEPEQVAQVLNKAAEEDLELFIFLWLAVTTGARRGEVVALRWSAVDLDKATLVVAHNYVVRSGQQQLKAPKTDEERRLSLDTVTVALLTDFKAAREAALAPAHLTLAPDAFLFSPDPACGHPWHPDHFTHAFRELAGPLGVDKPLKNLRHFNATQLLAAGVDLRTTAGRLGHSDGGATTLRVYASWTQAADRRAAEQFAGRMAALRRKEAAEEEPPVRAGGAAPVVRPLARPQRPVDEVLPGGQPARTFRDVAAGLREAIKAGRLDTGDLVPAMTEIADRYSVARSTAQRAVSLLGDEGLIIRSGHRWIVCAAVEHALGPGPGRPTAAAVLPISARRLSG
jgi:integrase